MVYFLGLLFLELKFHILSSLREFEYIRKLLKLPEVKAEANSFELTVCANAWLQ